VGLRFQVRDRSVGRYPCGGDSGGFLHKTPGLPNLLLPPGERAWLVPRGCAEVEQQLRLAPNRCLTAEPTPPRFKRGDADQTCVIALTDAIFTLNWLFAGGPAPLCQDAADSDDDGRVLLTDAVRTLAYLFLGGPPPALPGPGAIGPDPTPDDALPDCRVEEECP
jgi:hypothetical protein